MEKTQKQNDELTMKSLRIAAIEGSLKEREARTKDLEGREQEHLANEAKHKIAIDRFYEEISEISSMHTKKKNELESLVNNQVGIVNGFQREIERARTELLDKTEDVASLQTLLKGKDAYLMSLLQDLSQANMNHRFVCLLRNSSLQG